MGPHFDALVSALGPRPRPALSLPLPLKAEEKRRTSNDIIAGNSIAGFRIVIKFKVIKVCFFSNPLFINKSLLVF